MAYLSNPFLERVSERTTSDHEFVQLFSPAILEKIPSSAVTNGVHIFRSSPGGGKTTLLRAFTPNILKQFWRAKHVPELKESFNRLLGLGVMDENRGPLITGILLSCASGYADLPSSFSTSKENLFKALINCRVVLRTVRAVASSVGLSASADLSEIRIRYGDVSTNASLIPKHDHAQDLIEWAEKSERSVYLSLDSVTIERDVELISHPRLECIGWLQDISFIYNGKEILSKPLLMIDDLHKLRRSQRASLIEELLEIRATFPIWLSERKIAIGSDLLSQGSREGRDVFEYSLEDFWSNGSGKHQFVSYAKSILDRRLAKQDSIPSATFTQYLQLTGENGNITEVHDRAIKYFGEVTKDYVSNKQYVEWLARASTLESKIDIDSARQLITISILIFRNESNRQQSLEFTLGESELETGSGTDIRGAADIFLHEFAKSSYYFGIERMCTMASNNIEELLSLSARLFDKLKAKHALRKETTLTQMEQEECLLEVANRKREFISKSHTQGAKARMLIDAIGHFCRSETFLPSAPYAPGVTGVRLSSSQLNKLTTRSPSSDRRINLLEKVLYECVAENLLITRHSSETASRKEGTVFYLNRTMCAQYGLPLQYGGWRDVSVLDMLDWMEIGRSDYRMRKSVY